MVSHQQLLDDENERMRQNVLSTIQDEVFTAHQT